jgi:hypothetical protein
LGFPVSLRAMAEHTSPISTRRAFLIHLRTGTEVTRDQLVGRVEHVASGRAEHFKGEQQLWAFVFRILNDLEDKPNEEALPGNHP